jgi:hypothetical protein
MQKLSRNNSGKNNKSCRIFHNESNKIEFAFLWISTILYAFYKIQQFTTTIEDALLRLDPWNFLQSLNNTPTSHKTPREEKWGRNWVPGPRGGAGSPESIGSSGAPGRVRGGARPEAHLGPVGGRSWVEGVAGAGARRWPPAAAAAGRIPARRGRTDGKTRLGKVLWVLGGVLD